MTVRTFRRRTIPFLNPAGAELSRLERKVDRFRSEQQHHHSQQEENMSQVRDALEHLRREVVETRGAMNSAIAFIKGVPGLIRAAVVEALDANPDLTEEDLAAITEAANTLDSSQGDLVEALNANSGDGQQPATPAPPVEPAPEPEPLTPFEPETPPTEGT